MSATPAEYAARELKIAAMATLGHELPRRGKNGASALPPKAAAIATERRGRYGPLSAARIRSKNVPFSPSDQHEVCHGPPN